MSQHMASVDENYVKKTDEFVSNNISMNLSDFYSDWTFTTALKLQPL